MCSAPRVMAWSRNALNLISALHSTSGLGVRPAEYSRRNSAKTRSLYSAAKLTYSKSTPTRSATLAASSRSWRVEQYSERSEEHTSELQSLMRISYAVFCLKKKTTTIKTQKL